MVTAARSAAAEPAARREPAPLLPWLRAPLLDALGHQQAHALLVHGPEGIGQFNFALALAQAWLCETPLANRDQGLACGHCASCQLVLSRSHPDLRILVPEAQRAEAGLADDESAADDEGKKRKPSREIKVEQVRAALHFSELTAGRGMLKVVLVHPAEALNTVAANALLKTLEEPQGAQRFVLSCGAPQALLPTVRSRCQAIRLAVPARADALAWLQSQGVAEADALLDACGGQPLQALAQSQAGRGGALWKDLPRLVWAGDAAALQGWPLAVLVDALSKLCHDRALLALGARARYFPSWQMTSPVDWPLLTQCAAALRQAARHADHPWQAALAVEALVAQVRQALLPAATLPTAMSPTPAPVHSRQSSRLA